VREVVDVLEGADVSEGYPDWLGVRDARDEADTEAVPEGDRREVPDGEPEPVVDFDPGGDLDPVELTDEVRELVIVVVPVTEVVELRDVDTEAVLVTDDVDERLCLADELCVRE